MRSIILVLAWIQFIVAGSHSSTTKSLHKRKSVTPIIAQYWQEHTAVDAIRFSTSDLTFYSFANTNAGGFVEPDAGTVATFVQGAHATNTRALLSIGGWLGSRYFSDLVSTSGKRSAFANQINSYLARSGFDGIDFDWEYPNDIGSGSNIFSPNDADNFLIFLSVLRATIGPTPVLTVAVFTTPYNVNGAVMDMAPFAQHINYLNLMTFEVTNQGGRETGPLAPFENCRSAASVTATVAAYVAAGFPRAQMLIGIPSYVGSFTAASSTPDVTEAGSQRTTIYSPIVRPPVGICGAQDCNYVGLIDRGLLSPDGTTGLNGFTRTFDQCSSTPFLFNPSTREFLTYDDPQSVEVKAAYVRNNGLGGIFIFDSRGFPDQVYGVIRGAYSSSPTLASAPSRSSSQAAPELVTVVASSASTPALSSLPSSSATSSSVTSSSSSPSNSMMVTSTAAARTMTVSASSAPVSSLGNSPLAAASSVVRSSAAGILSSSCFSVSLISAFSTLVVILH